MTDIRQLEHFVALYKRRSFRVAADALGISQSTLTKTIQRLETDLGVRLFNRTTRSVTATDTARQLIGRAESALQAAGAFSEEARLLAGGEMGAVRVGAVALASETLIVPALTRLSRSHPNLEVEVVVGSPDVYRDLANGRCDIAIGDEANFSSSPYARGLRKILIQEARLILAHRVGHPATGAQTTAELLAFPLAVPSRYFTENRLFEPAAENVQRLVTPRYRLNSLSSCLTLASNSDVVILAPESVVADQRDAAGNKALVVAQVDPGLTIRLACVTVANNALTPAVRAFQAALGASHSPSKKSSRT